MIKKIEIVALCPRILSLENREITSYLKNHLDTINEQLTLEKYVYKKERDWVTAEKYKIKIKIFKSGIIEIKKRFIEQDPIAQLSCLTNIAQNVSINLFRSEVIYDISIYFDKGFLIDNDYLIYELKNYNSISSTLKNNIPYTIIKEEEGYRIVVKGIREANDMPKIFQSIISNKSYTYKNS